MSSSAPRPRRISVVLPVYNEHDNIERCLRGLWNALQGVEHEILVVYDFDEDTTLAAIAALDAPPPSLRLVKNELGRGAANALRAGFLAASGDVAVTTMADLSDPPQLIAPLAERVRAGAAVVAGSRYVAGGSQQGGPLVKRTLSRWAGVSLRWIAGVGTHDATSNFRAYSKEFLDTVAIESTGGFQIALELTVKAHLAGRGIDELPSSWIDRAAGESRFRLWSWLPSYLRWWLRAAAAPLAAWTLLAALCASWWMRGVGTGRERALLVAALALCTGAAALALVVARRLRGRNTWLDLLQPLVWLQPFAPYLARTPAPSAAHIGAFALALAASVALLALGVGPARLAAGVRRALGRVDERALALGAVWLLLWLKQLTLPTPMAEPLLDASWEQAVGRALVRGLDWGRDIFFSYGPLGWLFKGRYEPELWWTKLVWFELLFKGVLAGFLVAALLRIRGVLGRALFVVALVFPQSFLETELLQGVLAICAWLVLREGRGVAPVALATAALATACLVKFTVFVVCVPCFAIVVVAEAARRSPVSGAALGGSFLAAFTAVWLVAGQSLGALPGYLRSSLWIAGGYAEAMSITGPLNELGMGLALGAVIALVLVADTFRRPRDLARAALALALLWGLYVAGKAGYVRHLKNPLIYFSTVSVLPLLLPARSAAARGTPALEAALKGLRYACVPLALAGYAFVRGGGSFDLQALVFQPLSERVGALEGFLSPRELERALIEETRARRERFALPRVRAAVGERSIDIMHSQQAWLFLEDLRWTPRPAFQSYFAYTPELMEANRRFLSGERAPDFVLFQTEEIDTRLPGMAGTSSVLALLRDYAPRLVERKLVLFERRAGAPFPEPRRELVLEREARLGELVLLDLPADGYYLLALDVRHSALGALLIPATKAPAVHIRVRRRSGTRNEFRIVPAMMREGVLVEPLLFGQNEWLSWLGAEPWPAPDGLAGFRVDIGELDAWYEPTYGVRVERLVGLPEPEREHLVRERLFASFSPAPLAVECPSGPRLVRRYGLDLVVLPAPSELRFALEPGRHVFGGAFGLAPEPYSNGLTDGVSFRVLLRGSDGAEELLFERTLSPRSVAEGGKLQELSLRIAAQVADELVLRIAPGPPGDAIDDVGFWSEIRIEEER